jgi:hypothetical protein
MKYSILAVTFFDQSIEDFNSDSGTETLQYECMFTIIVDGKQVVLNANGDKSEANVCFNYDDADHTATDIDFTAAEVWTALEGDDWENNYKFLKEKATTLV